jgi:hypothetical protein
MLFVFNVFIFLKNDKKQSKIFYILTIISLIISLVGVYQPWTDMWYSPIPFVNNLREIAKYIITIVGLR